MGNKQRLFGFLLILGMLSLVAVSQWSTNTANAEAVASPEKAEYVLDEDFSILATSYDSNDIVASGWDVRKAGGSLSYSYNNWFKISDTSNLLPVSMTKKIREQHSGSITLEYRFKMPSIMNGVKWQLRSGEIEGVSLFVKDGNLVLETGNSDYQLQVLTANVEYGVKLIANLDENKVQVYVNGALKASEQSFTHHVALIDNFHVATGDVTTGEMFFAPVKLHKGYVINEKFISTVEGPIPEDWSSQLHGGAVVVEKTNNSKAPDVFSLKMNAANADAEMSIGKSFPSQTGHLVVEYKVFMPAKMDGFSMALKNGASTAFQWLTKDGKFAYTNTSGQDVAFYDYIPNLWYHVKLKMNTVTGKADLYLNGKLKVEQLDIPANSVNLINFSIAASNKGSMSFDDILLYQEAEEPQDYVPAPVQVNKEGDALVGAQACSMWREGQHLGWDRINPYPERVPLLGFYDEGSPEEADWEIKWMVEHGVDYQMYCWYRPTGSEGKPFKEPRLGTSLHDGYFNAKYSNQADFMIMWESSSSKVSGSEDFRNNVVPYWMEYYFKDPRYVVIDNKPVIGIFSYSSLKQNFGGTAVAVKAEMDYLRQAVQSAGFDDIIILISSGSDAAQMQEMQAAGLNAVFSYSWGQFAGKETLQKLKLEQQRDAGSMDVIPVISMGRDDRAWGGPMGYYATPQEFQSTAQWVKNSFIPSLPVNSIGRKLILLDNWNEYGEGHFIMPAGLHGFGYLDAIRNVFTAGGEHTNVLPTEVQKKRIQGLYPEGRVIPPKSVDVAPITDTSSITYSKVWDFNTNGDSEGWTVAKQVYAVSIAGGYYSGTSSGNDPGILSPDALGISAEENPYIHVRMKNSTNDMAGKIYFITEKDPAWKEVMGVDFYVNPNDGNYTDYYVPMWSNKNWTGAVKAIRLDPITTKGDFSIDRIGLVKVPIQGVKMNLNGQPTTTVTPLEIRDGSVMVPLAEVLKKADIPAERDDAGSILALKDGSVIRVVYGQSLAYRGSTPINLQHAPVWTESDLLISADDLKELFGFNFTWDAAAETLHVSSNSLKIKGDNLLTDPGMELGTLQYAGERIVAELTTSEYHSGHQSVKVTKDYPYGKILFNGVENGKEYYYSAWGKLASGTTIGEKLRICLQYKVDGVTKQVVMVTGPAMDAVSWKQTEGYFKLNETGNITNLTMYIYTDFPALGDSYYLDDVEIRPVTYSNDPIPARVTGISLNKSTMEMGTGNIGQLKATIQPLNAIERAVIWTSDNPLVAIVDVNGAVYGKKAGVAHITATTVDGLKMATSAVTVQDGFNEIVTLTVKPDGTGDFVSPKLANDSIPDSSSDKQYVILIYPGVYTEKNWVVKSYTTLRGTDRDQVFLKGENSDSATNNEITNQSTIWLKGTSNLENLTITARNMRYPVHSEDSGNNKDAIHVVKNSYIEHYGNRGAVEYRQNWVTAHPGVTPTADLDPTKVWGGISGVGSHAWGYGSASGVSETVYGTTFVSKADGWYVHNREDFTKPQINVINNSKIVSTETLKPIIIQSLGSGTKDEVIFNHTEIVGTYMVQDDSPWITQRPENQYANHADYNVTFNYSTPIGYSDEHRGRALALFSSSVTNNTYVRVSGNAVADLLGAYQTRDGGGGLSGYLYGYWDISGIKVGLSSNIDVNNTLGRRLGDCTVNSKTLQVTFENGTTKTIIFNENYTVQPNSYILGKINAVLGTSGRAAEYNVTGSEYYPQVPDKQLTLTNHTGVGIPRFAAVRYDTDHTTLRLMSATDSPDSFVGITLERIVPGASGRVLTEGIMKKSQLYGFTGSISKGTKISIGTLDGSLKESLNGIMLLEGVQTDWASFKGNRDGVVQ
ncbi:glycoside hydrolase family 99-like domain-containing protein [Paenibacillus sp. WQ 127069]|uniref:Glycoside hydrolase family 99-like domain-containing protein n=1 Tax=Paenibacillus baimaensis TaxID=2982185 RepID=A0ABT2UHB2_9BACL|nr:glycoside hydrolase family 99-like domain-containing protein [Paenibacillus sp. WQ 127069]MCU6794024.1 glycoside hydrolase family 99-like domain-containing protein [Paenibacillus sp. WQ 127069]